MREKLRVLTETKSKLKAAEEALAAQALAAQRARVRA